MDFFPDVQIIDIPNDSDDITILAHPSVTAGTTLGKLKGTPSYNYAKDMFDSFNVTVNDCTEGEKTFVATYEWMAKDPVSNNSFHFTHFPIKIDISYLRWVIFFHMYSSMMQYLS